MHIGLLTLQRELKVSAVMFSAISLHFLKDCFSHYVWLVLKVQKKKSLKSPNCTFTSPKCQHQTVMELDQLGCNGQIFLISNVFFNSLFLVHYFPQWIFPSQTYTHTHIHRNTHQRVSWGIFNALGSSLPLASELIRGTLLLLTHTHRHTVHMNLR